MALQSKTYTKSSETLFNILDGLKSAYDAAGGAEPNLRLTIDTNGNLCHIFNRGDLNTVLLYSDLSADSCILIVSGDGAWYTSMTSTLDPVFGL